jgi:hypothetical protein
MLTVDSTPWRRRRGEGRGEAPAVSRAMVQGAARGDGEEEARATLIYGAAAGYRTRGGGIDRRRQNIAVTARGGGEWRARARGGREFQLVGHSCASEEMARAAADASHLVLRIVQTPARPKKISAPPRIPRLLEGRFRLRAPYTGGFCTACAL